MLANAFAVLIAPLAAGDRQFATDTLYLVVFAVVYGGAFAMRARHLSSSWVSGWVSPAY
jgi:hypothetical protein